jgi:DNA replication factor Dna2
MRHSLFEATMKEQDFAVEPTIAHIRKIVKQNAEGLLSCNALSREAEQEILKFLPQLQRFANEYTEFGQVRGPRSLGQSALLESHGTVLPTQFIAKSAEAIEEPVISPELGLKGNVDMLVNAVTVKLDPQLGQQTATSIMGVELKTGHNQRPQNVHIAQLALYVVMLQTRYGTARSKSNESSAAGDGLLLYMNNEAVRAVHIAPMLSEIKSLIGMRNVVAIESLRAARPRGIRLLYEEDGESSKVTAK